MGAESLLNLPKTQTLRCMKCFNVDWMYFCEEVTRLNYLKQSLDHLIQKAEINEGEFLVQLSNKGANMTIVVLG